MPGYDCALHGPRFALPVCAHLKVAVERHEPEAAYLQYLDGHGVALCDACVRRWDVPDPLGSASCLLCVECLLEWERQVKNDFSRRCRVAKSEFPSGFVRTPDFVAPAATVEAGGSTFLFDGEWCVVTRTGAWPLRDHPHGFWPVLERPWPGVEDEVRLEGRPPFPFATVIDSVLAESSGYHYYLGRVFSYVVAGFPVSSRSRDGVLQALERCPERLPIRNQVLAALRA